MRRVLPSMLVREELDRLLHGSVDEGTNIVSALVDTVTRLVVQELLEGEQADYLGGRGRYERRGEEGDTLAPVPARHSPDVAPVAGRHWLR